jgi:tryptophanyl-tRNA synthetase
MFGSKAYCDELKIIGAKSEYRHFFDKDNGIIKSSRDLDVFLDHYRVNGPESGYIYTGRGPSSADMHLGHMVPFMVARELQKILGVRVVIQLTDDEKFLYRAEHSLETYQDYALKNRTYILKCGFDPELTTVYINTLDIAQFYPTILKIQSKLTYSEVSATFGLESRDNIGKVGFPAYEMALCDPRSLFPPEQAVKMRCLVVCAWDQDPFFRLVRDCVKSLKFHKPSILHLNYLPALSGSEKMSSTGDISSYSIWLSDTNNQIKNKIKRYAFSGGGKTLEDQRTNGANTDIDVSCIYLKFFMTDRNKYHNLIKIYKEGTIDSKLVKDTTSETISELISKFY